MPNCNTISGYHCQFVELFKDHRGEQYETAEIVRRAVAGGMLKSIVLPNDHAVQAADATERPNKQPWCEFGDEFGCWEAGIPIFTRLQRGLYRVNEEQYWCDGTPV